jgi:signal transduction histidine kinase
MVTSLMPRGRTVLVVDDNGENRALAQATLEDEGVRVVLANDAAAGIAAFERDRPECILLDIRMPGIDGIEACKRLRALPGGADVAIIFVTAQRDVETFDRALAAGGDDFITKPFRPSELVVRVQTALRLRALASERSELVEQIKHQRDQMQRLQLQKEQLTAFLVHDLKNPVSSIELHAQIVMRDKTATDRSKRAAASIQDETRALLRMITNLLDLAKADEGQLAPAKQPLDPTSLVRGVLDELTPRATAAGIALTPHVEAERVVGDPDILHRVLANLVDNAIRHAPEASEVVIRVAPAGDTIELRVIDAGPGVPENLRDKVFERFQSGERTARSNRGLGLAFCKQAVEAHGGQIWIEDGGPGAVFAIRLGNGD